MTGQSNLYLTTGRCCMSSEGRRFLTDPVADT